MVGMDGCPVNCEINNFMELIFWHSLLETDGVTAGPECLTGPIGSTLKGKIWEDPVVSFTPITGNVKEGGSRL